jgi:hypothetical protein
MTLPKMPEPAAYIDNGQPVFTEDQLATFAKLYGLNMLEAARLAAWEACNPDGDDFGNGYNQAAVVIERAIRRLGDLV